MEIFSGTGGVGKTTLATSRALKLCSERKVLLITIDPAKRLKQLLHINDSSMGEITCIDASIIDSSIHGQFDALLMDPMSTFRRINPHNKEINPILKNLLGPYGSLNEIMSIIELNYHLESQKYDTIILDTPPGKNFIEFLKASKRIQAFFRPQFIQAIAQLRDEGKKKTPKFIKQLVQTGIQTLLKYLKKVTGEEFIQNFLDALNDVYHLTPHFQKAMSLHQKLKNSENVIWYLVTSVDQSKIQEAIELYNHSNDFLPMKHTILINKAQKLTAPELITTKEQKLVNYLYIRENQLLEAISENFSSIQTFSEVLSSTPREHIVSLTNEWT